MQNLINSSKKELNNPRLSRENINRQASAATRISQVETDKPLPNSRMRQAKAITEPPAMIYTGTTHMIAALIEDQKRS